MPFRTAILIATVLSGLVALPAFAHGTGSVDAARQQPSAAEQKGFGIAGDAARVNRTIYIRMTDRMRFEPALIQVRQGETIRFVHSNVGKMMHEMVIGTRADLEEHAALMRKFPDMEHEEPHMAHVAAGRRGQLIWHFNRAGEFEFACLIPGHFESGMRGIIKVAAR